MGGAPAGEGGWGGTCWGRGMGWYLLGEGVDGHRVGNKGVRWN